MRTVMSLLPVPPRTAIPTTPIAHSPQTHACPFLPPITGQTSCSVTQGTCHSLLHPFLLLLSAVPRPLFNPIRLRSQATAQMIMTFSIQTISFTRLMLMCQKMVQRIEVSTTTIMEIRSTQSTLKPGRARTRLDLWHLYSFNLPSRRRRYPRPCYFLCHRPLGWISDPFLAIDYTHSVLHFLFLPNRHCNHSGGLTFSVSYSLDIVLRFISSSLFFAFRISFDHDHVSISFT